MPLQMVHLNGSVNLPDTETVMRALAERIPKLRRIPDGETGSERKIWLAFQMQKFLRAQGLEAVEPPADDERPVELKYSQTKLSKDTDPMQIGWPEIGYCGFYRESWNVFDRLARNGVIAADVRFQVQFPTPLAAVSSYVVREDALLVEPSYERALFGDLDQLLDSVPHSRIAVQWDLPVEIGVLEAPELFAVADKQSLESVARGVARCISHVPSSVPVGMHLCYGDAEHRHWKEPVSLRTQVELVNAVEAIARREINWCSFTVPQYVRDAEYFAPLANLTPSLAEPYLALVPYHPGEQQPGTVENQVRLVEQCLGQRPWGICTECGLVNVDRGEIPALLDLHSEILRRFVAAQ